ncbi:MAG: cytochrome c3 family protein [Anaeromyxobacter sp.]
MRFHPVPAILAAAALLSAPALIAAAPSRGPVRKSEAVSTHAPYAAGQCSRCHVRDNPNDPGPAPPFDEGCLECHEDFKGPVQLDSGPHPTGGDKLCVDCHNAHNAPKKHLLM